MPLAIYLGIDAGHGHTDAVIGDDKGNVLGRGQGGPSGDHPEEPGGRETVRQSLETAIRGALDAASAGSLAHVTFAGVHCAMTSAHAEKAPILTSLIKADQLDVTSGAPAALLGATSGEAGIVVLGGVGAFAYGEAWNGVKASAGGWGHLFGGEGGGFWMAAEGLRAAASAHDRIGPATLLLETAKQHFRKASLSEVTDAYYSLRLSRAQLATFAERVYACAVEGDVRAREIVVRTGAALAELVWSVRSALPFPSEAMSVAPIGGMFSLRLVRDTFWSTLQMDMPLARMVAPRFDPAVGALIGAYKAAGLFRSEVLARLEKCCPPPEKLDDFTPAR
jgi:N-acetylglucosamine kinase-like BadF-type ATPase